MVQDYILRIKRLGRFTLLMNCKMDFHDNCEVIGVKCHSGISSSNNINSVIDKDLPFRFVIYELYFEKI